MTKDWREAELGTKEEPSVRALNYSILKQISRRVTLSLDQKGISVNSDEFINTQKAISYGKKLGVTPPKELTVNDLSAEWELTQDTIIWTTSNSYTFQNGKTEEWKARTVLFGSFNYNSKGSYENGTLYKSVVEKVGSITNEPGEKDISYQEIYLGEDKVGASLSVEQILAITENQGPSLNSNAYNKGDQEYEEVKQQYLAYLPEGWENNPWGANILPDQGSLISLYDQYYSALTSGNAVLTSKNIKWKTFSDFSSADAGFYTALEWGSVNISKLQKFQGSTIDWSEVQFGEFTKKQYKQTNWSQIDFEDFQAEDYNEVNWAQVKFKGSKAPNVAELDMSLVVEADSFSKKNAKQINWGQLSTDDLSSDALSKLEGFNVKKKGVNVVDLLSPGTQSNALSFAGVDGGGSAWTPVASTQASTGAVFPIAADVTYSFGNRE